MKKARLFFVCMALINTAFGQDVDYPAVIQQLFRIDELDQRYRNQIELTETRYGKGSPEIKVLYQKMLLTDSINLISVDSIIEKYGWLGDKEIGSQGNTTLFMIIQHSNLRTWKKYLPVMREAVNNGKARAAQFALLQDRLDLHEGRKQKYGSQIVWSAIQKRYLVMPIDDPDSVDVRRIHAGLQPLSVYLSPMSIKWDVEQYKKDLPMIEGEWKKLVSQ